jgi:hypothetical protein
MLRGWNWDMDTLESILEVDHHVKVLLLPIDTLVVLHA